MPKGLRLLNYFGPTVGNPFVNNMSR